MSGEQTAQNETRHVVVLHLSDLHFGGESATRERDDRKITLDSLLTVVSSLELEWHPHCVCISGDVGWKGAREDYEQAEQWLQKLLDTLKLGTEALVMCPGNHDVDRSEAAKCMRPNSAADADAILATDPIPPQCNRPFKEYVAFCTRMGLVAPAYGSSSSHLVGVRELLGIRLVVLNSAWFSRNEQDKGNLWFGLPHIRHLEATGQLRGAGTSSANPVTVVLTHHPREWLAENEYGSYGGRPSTLEYLAERCDLLLTGHTHGGVLRADSIAGSAWHLRGGTAYQGAQYPNSFRLIRIEPNGFVSRAFEFDPRSSVQAWRPRDAESLRFGETSGVTSAATESRSELVDRVRKASLRDALRAVEMRSRQLKPYGDLPEGLDRLVAVAVPEERPRDRGRGEPGPPEERTAQMPLTEAVANGRRCLLLGDLGSGKSTLAAKLVVGLAEDGDLLPLLVPAPALRVESHRTVGQVVREISTYVSDQIMPEETNFDLEGILADQVEVTLVVDGLDEMPRADASSLLKALGSLVAHWPSIRILATGRPVELHGVPYQDWQILRTLPLTDDEKTSLFKAETVAEGKSEQEADVIAGRAIDSLRRRPALDALTATPLAARLLCPRLPSLDENQTLGDLLLDLLYERLGRWDERNGRSSTTPRFDAEFPDPPSKAKIFGKLAADSLLRGLNTKEGALERVRQIASGVTTGADAVAAEAVAYFETAGLLNFADGVKFPLQPLCEVAAGLGVLQEWRTKDGKVASVSPSQWRVVSFAGTAARRRGVVEEVREHFSEFIDSLLTESGGLPAACYIVVELGDTPLAQETIGKFDQLGPKPLTVLREEEAVSANTVAEALRMAGDSGFDWFYREYLDPRFPYTSAGSLIYGRIFENWAYFSRGILNQQQKSLLGRIVRPHVTAGTHQVLDIVPALSMLVPEAFEEQDRLWFQSAYLDHRLFGEDARQALKLAFESGSRGLVDKVLLNRAGGGQSEAAALLWLKLHPDDVPPVPILKATIRATWRRQPGKAVTDAVSDCSRRLGEARWLGTLRWFLSDPDHHLAGCSAVRLFRAGHEGRLEVLGNPLLDALHDGGYNATAEDALGEILDDAGADGVRWLAEQFPRTHRVSSSAHSGWWRLFLSRIDAVGDDGPGLLAYIAGAIGPFIMPRYPEIRQAFRALLHGPLSIGYRSELQNKLVHMDPTVRRGAAVILAVSDPGVESDALDTIIRGRPGTGIGRWDEWERFLLSVRFGPSVLAYVASRLATYVSNSRPLAFAILARNDWALADQDRRDLLRSILDLGNWSLGTGETGQPLLATDDAYQVLTDVLTEGPREVASRAAQELMRHHRGSLTPDLEARCLLLTVSPQPWLGVDVPALLQRLSGDADFAERIRCEAEEIGNEDGQIPLLERFRRALGDRQEWKEVLWSLFAAKQRGMLEVDDAGHLVVHICRQDTSWASAIGQAAVQLLGDSRVRESRQGEAVNWIALLGDEYGGLPPEELAEALQTVGVIESSSAAAVIARLSPKKIKWVGRSSVGCPPSDLTGSAPPQPDGADSKARLADASRPGDDFHPEMCNALETAVLCGSFTETELSAMGKGGAAGAMIAATLRFTSGWKPSIQESLVLMRFRRDHETAQDRCVTRLLHIWRNHVRATRHESEDWRADLVRAINESLPEADHDKARLAAQVIILGGDLPCAQVQTILESCAEYPWTARGETGAVLAKWLAEDHTGAERDATVDGVKRAIAVLDEKPWDAPGDHPGEASAYLLFAVAYWALNAEESVACSRVFLRGMKLLMVGARGVAAVQVTLETFAALDPLLAKVDPALLRSALGHGLTSEDPVLRTICRLFIPR